MRCCLSVGFVGELYAIVHLHKLILIQVAKIKVLHF